MTHRWGIPPRAGDPSLRFCFSQGWGCFSLACLAGGAENSGGAASLVDFKGAGVSSLVTAFYQLPRRCVPFAA